MTKRKHPIEYLPPAEADIAAYAEQVCKRMAVKQGADFADADVVQGLAAFMKIAARIQVKHLNRSCELVDNDSK